MKYGFLAAARLVLVPTLVAVEIALLRGPQLADAFALVRERVLAGELWRLFTGHLVNATPRSAVVDLAMVAVLGAWWERRSRATCAWILAASAGAASLALLAFTALERYAGSSALGSGLFVGTALVLALEQRGGRKLACVLLLVLFAVKCALEAAGTELLSVLPPRSLVAATAHAAGGAAGALVVLVRRRQARLRAARRARGLPA